MTPMDFKDYYATLGVERTATQAQIKSAYRKLARKYHPDVSKEPDAEARFKEVAEAYEALNDAERRAAYDAIGNRHKSGQEFRPPPGWESGSDFNGSDFGSGATADHSAFFESLFRRAGAQGPRASAHQAAGDHHAKVQIELQHAYQGGHHSISLRTPRMEANGQVTMQDRKLDVNIPKGIRAGQHLRLAGQGGAAHGNEPAGDLYLEIEFAPHPHFRVEGRDVYLDLPVSPWEATLGATVAVPTPDGSVQLTLPAGSSAGRKMRLKGKGLPGVPPGDLYAVLTIALPPADSAVAQEAYRGMATSFADFNPRRALMEA